MIHWMDKREARMLRRQRLFIGFTVLAIVAAAAFIALSGCVSTGRRQVQIAENVPTSQPMVAPVTVHQDSAGVIAKADLRDAVKAEVWMQVQPQVQAQLEAFKIESQKQKTVNYSHDVWVGRIAVVLAFAAFIFARWQAKKHGYWRQRDQRLFRDRTDPEIPF